MTLTKLINILREQREKLGNIEVYIEGLDDIGQAMLFDIHEINMCSSKSDKNIKVITLSGTISHDELESDFPYPNMKRITEN